MPLNLIEAAALLLSENGIFSVIVPYKEEKILGPPMNMNCIPKNYSVKGTPTTETKRSLLALVELKLVISPQMN
jgi:tRNA1Val (adenine37-N6)-methyltransferase